MMKRLTLRARMTLLIATTVALALAGCAAGAWFLTRAQLYSQLNASLSSPPGGGPIRGRGPEGALQSSQPDQGIGGPNGKFVDEMLQNCGKNVYNSQFGGIDRTTQAVRVDGQACPRTGSASLVVTSADIAVAKGLRDHVFRDGVTSNGVPMRIYTQYNPSRKVAVSTAEPLGPTLNNLDTLALWLGGVSILGIAMAASVGMLIARASLRPVDKLTDSVEHIAKTEDLDTRIPVDGRDEIARLSQSFNTMTTALAAARDHQRRLIADAGHELRTPLTSLRTNIDLLIRSESTGRLLPPETRSRMLSNVKAQLHELSSLVGDLLELARPEQTPASVEVVALHDVVVHAVERAKLRGPGLRIEGSIAKWYVNGDPSTLQRAVVNLLDNAVKYSPPGGTVEVDLTDQGVLTVRDHGPGIAPEDLPHVFERFWRSPSSRSMPGSGLGLSIVARVVQEAGGDVRLDRAAGGGTIATVKLPGSIDYY